MARRETAIIGAGVAGTATALALGRVGIESVVLERRPGLEQGGGALMLWPNAVKVLRELGVDGALAPHCTHVRTLRFLEPDGRPLFSLDLDSMAGRFGAPVWMSSRADLLRTLEAGARSTGQRISYGETLVDFTVSSSGVSVETGVGRAFDADVLIGADGIDSRVRSRLFGDRPRRSVFHAAWIGRAKLPPGVWPFPPGESVIVIGRRGRRLFATTIGEADESGPRTVAWYATEKRSAFLEGAAFVDPATLRSLFADWKIPILSLIDHSPELTPIDVHDRPPAMDWGRGRVSLLGDAIHSSTPDLGQGACQALESALALARNLARPGVSAASALRRYERGRRVRTARVNLVSWLTAIQSSIETPGAAPLRRLGIRTLLPTITRAEFQFLFGHEP